MFLRTSGERILSAIGNNKKPSSSLRTSGERRFSSFLPSFRVTLETPHQTLLKYQNAKRISLPGTGVIESCHGFGGEFSDVAELQPGVVTITRVEEDGIERDQKFMISGGFAFVHEDRQLFSLSVPDAVPVLDEQTDVNRLTPAECAQSIIENLTVNPTAMKGIL